MLNIFCIINKLIYYNKYEVIELNLSKNTFLYAYASYLIICLFLVVRNESSSNINNIISAITIASTLISLAELFYTKSSIDKKERVLLPYLHKYYRNKCNQIIDEIVEKYKDDASRMLEEVLISDDEVEYDEIKDVEIINKGIQKAIKKEKINFTIANVIATVAFALLLFVLTVDNIFGAYTSNINNFLTVFAFLSVISNMIMKDNYKAKSLKELNQFSKSLISDE